MERNEPLPRSEEAEKVVIGTIISDKNALPEIREMLAPEAFFYDIHKEIYEACIRIADRGEMTDIVTVMNELRKSKSKITPYDLTKLAANYTPSIGQHAAIIYDKYKRRQFYEIGCYLQSNCFSEEFDIMDVMENARKKLDGAITEGDDAIFTMKDALTGVYETINRNLSSTGKLTGYPTGFSDYDRRSGGLQTSDLVIIAAESSQGKTSMAIKIAMNTGCPIAFYSMEMKKEQIAARMLSIQTGVPANKILFSRLGEEKLYAIDKGISKMVEKPIYFDDKSTSNIDGILASIRRMKTKYDIKGVVVDYLQILNVNMKNGNKEQQMADVARRLKNIAKDLDIWVIALSQLNRDRDNPVPSMSRLRDSGQIAEAADVVMLIYRPEIYNNKYPDPFQNAETKGTAMIDIAKGRNIGIMKFIVGFESQTTNFHELNEVPFKDNVEDDNPF